jgi:hypothetical protein
LSVRSPFLPPAAADGGDPGVVPSLELRGIMETGEGARFSIFDSGKKAGVWVKLEEAGPGFVVKQYDPARDTVMVEQAGRMFALGLRRATVASANGVAASGTASFAAFSGMAIPDEARRQEAVAGEVSRRLAVRAQANSPARQL